MTVVRCDFPCGVNNGEEKGKGRGGKNEKNE